MTEKPSILVVEDEAKMRRLLELELADQDFHAQTVADAETALKLLNTNQFDLIVTDLKLPGMSGMEFLQAVKRANAAIPIIIMTAFGTVESETCARLSASATSTTTSSRRVRKCKPFSRLSSVSPRRIQPCCSAERVASVRT